MKESNQHPADRLADIRARIRNLEQEEVELRDYLLEHEGDRVGDLFIAQVGAWPRRRLDIRALAKELGQEIVERFSTKTTGQTIRLKSRQLPED